MADLVAWACRTPQRLVTVAAVTLIAVLGAGSLALGQLSGGGPEPTTRPSSTVQAQVPDAGPFVDAAVAFAARWAAVPAGQDAEQWRAGLQPLVTADLAAGLRLTDPADLPGGVPTGTPAVRYVSVSSALVAVPLSSGTTVLVTVVDQQGTWTVSDVQPDAGDHGAP